VTVIAVLFVALAILTLAYVGIWVVEARKSTDTPDPGSPDAERIAVGFFANFFDALGIGSFATSTTYFRLRKLVRDELIPGTLNVGYCLPTITQAFIGIAVIAVDPMTLVLFIATAVAGAWFGAGVVSRMPRRAIQVGMGIALLVAAGFMLAKVTRVMPSDDVRVGAQEAVIRESASAGAKPVATLAAGTRLELLNAGHDWSKVRTIDADTNGARPEGYVETAAAQGIVLGVTGLKLALGLVGSFFLGSIMPLGIGYYAPCMVLIAVLGMSPSAAFPIMMGACAFLMPVASAQFVRLRKYSLRTAIGMAIGGIFGSALALLVVKSLNLYYVMWLVTVVIVYTGVSLLHTAAREKKAHTAGTPTA
jgi:uncharacterized membrane protein YfcA